MSISNMLPYLGDGHQSRLTESCDGYSRILPVALELWDPTLLESLAPELVTPSVSRNAANTSFQCLHSTDSTEGHRNSSNMVETDMSQDHTTSSKSWQSSALADDERFMRRSEGQQVYEDRRMGFIWRLIKVLLNRVDCYDCPRTRELWLSIIEGEADDDLWLWVDGDEEWLIHNAVSSL
ncbi:hypothetical protein EDD17DRAFT_813006 [Pisolithus thermaeus]|nr:hypothetical protein EDD17DRAFT_813006 [Pisolithus thermaeus]